MSGGILGNLAELLALCEHVDALKVAERELLFLGERDVADRVAALVKLITAANTEFDRLREVLRTVEWKLSGDYGVDQVHDACTRFERAAPRPREAL